MSQEFLVKNEHHHSTDARLCVECTEDSVQSLLEQNYSLEFLLKSERHHSVDARLCVERTVRHGTDDEARKTIVPCLTRFLLTLHTSSTKCENFLPYTYRTVDELVKLTKF